MEINLQKYSSIEDYLAKPPAKPQLIITIGIPGSGKSYSMRTADKNIWHTISSDDLRVNELTRMQEQGLTIEIDAETVPADPKDPKHIFSSYLRDWSYQQVEKNRQ